MRLPEKLKDSLTIKFRNACDEIGDSDKKYVLMKFNEKFEKINLDEYPSIIQESLKKAELFKRIIEDSEKGLIEVDDYSISAMTAALIYFLNPWDFIPDQIPEKGYDDDAYVINLCFNFVKDNINLEFNL